MSVSLFKKSALIMLTTTALVSCASVVETPNQSIEFVSVGAPEVQCDVKIGDSVYQADLPQTIHVKKSQYPMELLCLAAGNRQKEMVYDPSVSKFVAGNITTAGVGAMYDYASGAMFTYPEKVTVDFTDVVAQRYDLPDYEITQQQLGYDSSEIEYLGADVLESRSSIVRGERSGWLQERNYRKSSVETGYKAPSSSQYNGYAAKPSSDAVSGSVEDDSASQSPYFPRATFPGTTSF